MWRQVALFALAQAGFGQQAVTGPIDAAKALKALYGNYDVKTRTSTDSNSIVGIYETQDGVINGKRVWFLYTTSNTKSNDCHACQVTLGAAIFEQQGDKWVNIVDDRSITQTGSYGQPQPGKPVQWGKDAYGLMIDEGWTGQGTTTNFISLWGFENGSFKHVFEVQVLEASDGYFAADHKPHSWEIQWSFGPPAPNGIFDLVFKMKPGSYIPPGAEGLPVPGVYRFDGSRYKHVLKGVVLKAE
jgi:hypothetical protein